MGANPLGILLNRLQNAKRYFQIISCPYQVSFNLKAVQKFCLFANEKLLKLKNKKYSDYQFAPGEWEILGFIQEVLAVCDSI